MAVPSVMGAVGWGARQSSGVQLTATRSALAVCSLHCAAPSAQHVLCVLQCVFPGQCAAWPVFPGQCAAWPVFPGQCAAAAAAAHISYITDCMH